MSNSIDHQRGRLFLLTSVFILLAGMIVLVYTHPDKKAAPKEKISSYEHNIRDIWYKQTSQLVDRRDFHNAKLAANKILQSLPEDIFAQRVLVRIAWEENDLKTALRMCRKILLKNPEDAFSRNNLAVLLFPDSPADARREIAIAVSLLPDDPVIAFNQKQIIPASGNVPAPEIPRNIPADMLTVKPDNPGVSP